MTATAVAPPQADPSRDERVTPLASPAPGVRLALLALDPRSGDEAAALLDAADRARLAVLPPASARALLARRALVAAVVADATGVPADRLSWDAAAGAPLVRGAGVAVAVSLSSSGGRGLLAVADSPVGVDLEDDAVLPDAAAVAVLLAPAERAWVLAGAGDAGRTARLLAVWVRKEAVVKCTGEGLGRRDPRSFTVDATGRPGAWSPVLDDDGAPTGLLTTALGVPGGHAALAVRRPGG